jgi:hypothetical protein
MKKEGGHIVETAIEARAGYLDRPVMAVLIVSTVLVCALFGFLYLVYFA